MNNSAAHPESGATIWLQSFHDGLSGLSIKVKHALHCEASPFQKIEVFDTYSYGKVLVLGGSIVLTEKDEFIYNEMICHPALLSHRSPEKVCIIGGGDGGAAREALKHPSVSSVTVVEIDEKVPQIAGSFFPQIAQSLEQSAVSLVIDDGCQYLEKNQELYDIIIVDAYDPGGPVQSLQSGPFYELVKNRLTPQGLAVFQTDSPTAFPDTLRQTIKNVAPLFTTCRPFWCSVPSFPEGCCSFCLCAQSQTPQSELADTTEYLETLEESCRYFNRDMCEGAFKLPETITTLTKV